MRHLTLYCLCCLLTALLPLYAPLTGGNVRDAAAIAPPWPTHFEGAPLTEIPLDERESRFAEGFPGAIAVFSDGQRHMIMRWTHKPTRKLHPAAHCFRGTGYTVQPRSPHTDVEGRLWGSFTVTKGDDVLTVRERVFSETWSWTDVSAWYWAALFRKDPGPWWSITVITPSSGVGGE